MRRVEMIIGCRRALVDEDMVRKMTRKEQLLAATMAMQDKMDTEKDPATFRLLPGVHGLFFFSLRPSFRP